MHGVGRLAFVEGNMEQFAYIDVHDENVLLLKPQSAAPYNSHCGALSKG